MFDHTPAVTITGDLQPSGAYILRIRLHNACDVVFGRFNQGQPVMLPDGDYLYVGSAMGKRGSSTLANRLLRHARRADADRPSAHLRRSGSLIFSKSAGPFLQAPPLATRPFAGISTICWNSPKPSLTQIYIACSRIRFESALAGDLLADPATRVVVPGLGASDDRGSTHLLLVDADEQWWRGLPQRMIPPSS